MHQIISQIRRELQAKADPRYKEGALKYFGGDFKSHGVRTPKVRKISQKHFSAVKAMDKKKIFVLIEKLLESGYQEESVIAFDWINRLKVQLLETDFVLFENWLKNYVDNWAKCDDLCGHALGAFVLKFPEVVNQLKTKWVKSSNQWLRRAAAVALIPAIRKNKKFLPDVFEVCEKLLMDKDDLVQKGYGWLLKETSKKNQRAVFEFVLERKNYMPRTALRYAIEKMPANLRQQAMAK